MNISLITAMSINHVIGVKNKIPWVLAHDLAWFKANTINKPIIVGRITYEIIGNPLPKRLNIILSKIYSGNKRNVIWVNSINKALAVVGEVEEIMIIGGEKIYQLFLPIANRLYLTHVDTKIMGDAYFPFYKQDEWYSIFTEYHKSDKNNSHNYYFEILERC